MNIISNNCCGARLYQVTNIMFNNPFVWMILSYDSIYYLLNHFTEINWLNYDFEKSSLRKNTFIISVDNKIKIHYVHYYFDPKAKTLIKQKENAWTGDIKYCRIWEFINEKYLSRVKRMMDLKEEPMFLIKEDEFSSINSKHSLDDIANCSSSYKRIIITKNNNIKRNDNICKTILINKIEDPMPTIKNNFNDIKNFFNL